MTLRVRQRVEAAAELDAAIDWYARRRTVLGVELFAAVTASIEGVLTWPDSGRPYPGLEHHTPIPRTKRVKGFPYTIVYLVDGDDLVILAYSHDKQRPGYWRDRTES